MIEFLNHPINEDGRGNGHQNHQSEPQYSGHHCPPWSGPSGSLATLGLTSLWRANGRAPCYLTRRATLKVGPDDQAATRVPRPQCTFAFASRYFAFADPGKVASRL